MAIEVLNQEPTTKNDLDVDCILSEEARKAILDHQYSDNFCIDHNIDHSINTGMALIALSDLPPITSQKQILSNISDKIETKYKSISYGNNDYDDGFVDALEWVRDVIDDCKKERNKI